MENTFVNQIMSKKVLTVNISETLEEVAKKMKQENIGCVIVVDKIATLGIITERDFVTKIVAERVPRHTKIFEVMSSPLITIESEETVWEAAEIMKNNSIHKLPVLEDGEIVGIVTATDIVKISSAGSDSQMRKICDQILMRMKDD